MLRLYQTLSIGKMVKGVNYSMIARFSSSMQSSNIQIEGQKSFPYQKVVQLFSTIENMRERKQIISLTSDLFKEIRSVSPNDLLPTMYLITNEVAPVFKGEKLGIGDGLIMKAIEKSTNIPVSTIKEDMRKKGDLGDVAAFYKQESKIQSKGDALTVNGLFSTLKYISKLQGKNSQSLKIQSIQSLLEQSQPNEVKYIIRSLQGKLRIGLADQSLLSALSQTFSPSTSSFHIIKQAMSECPSYDILIHTLLNYPLSQLHSYCHLTPGIPAQPMLAQPVRSVDEVFKQFDSSPFLCEYKYDGERVQIHKTENNEFHIFSRNNEDITERFPDLISSLQQHIPSSVSSCILDGECVAWDTQKHKVLAFQVLSTRARKGVKKEDVKVNVALFLFDMLYLNGKSLLQQPFQTRRDLLHSSISEQENLCYFVTSKSAKSPSDVETMLNSSVASGCEGLMIKGVSEGSEYVPGKRSSSWLKLKKDYLDGFGDSFDLVPIGGYFGKGKRTGLFGAFLLACYDRQNEEYQSICKIGSGFRDESLQLFSKQFSGENVLKECPKNVHVLPSMIPDVWFAPSQVWEVRAADLSLSPAHTAASNLTDSKKGIGLRFPRFLRVRDDKKPELATTNDQILSFFKKQTNV